MPAIAAIPALVPRFVGEDQLVVTALGAGQRGVDDPGEHDHGEDLVWHTSSNTGLSRGRRPFAGYWDQGAGYDALWGPWRPKDDLWGNRLGIGNQGYHRWWSGVEGLLDLLHREWRLLHRWVG